MANKIKKINVEKIKPPYIILTNHGSVMDNLIVKKVMFPQSISMISYKPYANMYEIIKSALNKKKIVVLFPEVHPSIDGTQGILDENLASILKELKTTIVVMKKYGSYLASPLWNKSKNDNEIHVDMRILCRGPELEYMEEESLQEEIQKNLIYDDYGWQRSEKIAIMGKDRCNGIEKILYRCPQCLEENKIIARGDKVYCSCCGKQWIMTEYGELKASLDDSEYTRIPDWYAYERSCVIEEILSGNYSYMGRVMVEEVKHNKVLIVEPGILWHNSEGLILKYMVRGKEENIVIPSEDMYTCGIEYGVHSKGDCIRVRHNGVTLCLYGLDEQERFNATKIKFAIEELYKMTRQSKVFTDRAYVTEEKAVAVNVEELIHSEEQVTDKLQGNIIAVEYIDDNIVTKEQARMIREQAKTVETDEVS